MGQDFIQLFKCLIFILLAFESKWNSLPVVPQLHPPGQAEIFLILSLITTFFLNLSWVIVFFGLVLMF